MSLPSDSAISAPTPSAMPTMNAIDLAPQWIGEPSRSSRPAAANMIHVQPLPSMPKNVSPSTVPLGKSNVKLRSAKTNPRMPSASAAMPMIATGPFASDTPRRGGAVSSYLVAANCDPPVAVIEVIPVTARAQS